MVREAPSRRWSPRRLLAPASTPRLERTADIIGCFINSLGLIWGAAASALQWSRHQLTPGDAVIVGILLPLTAVTTGWIGLAVWRRRPARVPLVVHTALCGLQVLIFLAFWQATPGQTLPPLTFSIELSAAAAWTCLAWPLSVFDLLYTVSLGGVVMARTGAMGQTHAFILNLGNSAYYGAIGLVATMAWTAIVTVVKLARRASDASAESSAQLVAAQEAAAASNHWDGVIHDHVLNALGAVARNGASHGADARVRILARQALVALERTGDRPRPAALTDRLAATARTLGLDARIEISGEPPASIAERIARAAEEALTNVARHAGTAGLVVSGACSAERVTIMIRDKGRGFDPGQVPESRHGLRGSVFGAMEVAGGHARVDSAPGRGTTVTLSWNAPGTEAVRLSRIGAFRAMIAFFVLTVAISFGLGWVEHDDVVRLRSQIALGVVLLGAVAAAFMWEPLNRLAQAMIAGTTICYQVLMFGNMRAESVLSWQEWFIGFGLGVFGPLAWRTRSRLWVGVVAASWPVVTVGGALINGADPLSVMLSRVSSYTWPLILSFAAAWAATSMHDSLRSIAASRETTLGTVRQRARTDATRLEAERRLATIKGEPMEMLDYLACGGELTGSVRRRCALLEASTRDLLVAPFVVDEGIRESFRAARRRGAVITITGLDPVEEEFRGVAEAFREVCVILADAAPQAGRLTCRWHPGQGGSTATVALGGFGVADGLVGSSVEDATPGGDLEATQEWRRRETALRLLAELAASSLPGVDILDAGEAVMVTIDG